MIENAILFNLKKIIFYRAAYPHRYRECMHATHGEFKKYLFFLIFSILLLISIVKVLTIDMILNSYSTF